MINKIIILALSLLCLNGYAQSALTQSEKIEIHVGAAQRILNLNDKQVKKYEKIYTKFVKEISETKKTKIEDSYQKVVKRTAINDKRFKAVEKILTEVQLERYKEWQGFNLPDMQQIISKHLQDFENIK